MAKIHVSGLYHGIVSTPIIAYMIQPKNGFKNTMKKKVL